MESKMRNVTNQVRQVFKSIEQDTNKATVAALNKSGKSALSNTLKEFRSIYNIKLQDLNKITSIEKATKTNQYVTVKFLDKSLGLEYFRSTQKKKGIAVSVKKGERKLYKSSFYINVNASGAKIIAHRLTKNRLPIERLFGANPARILTTEESLEEMTTKFFKIFEKNFNYALNYYLK